MTPGRLTAITIGFLVLMTVAPAIAASTQKGQKEVKKRVVYRAHTELDFSGDTVQGKVRAPEVFYVFQRRRSEERHMVKPPASLSYQSAGTQSRLEEALPQ